MDSIIGMHDQREFAATPEAQLARYQACLIEFEQLQYSDKYILQIKQDIKKLQALIAKKGEAV
ncbi:hypothetical protein L2719_10670 [Shewanella schlegeliana]|uniref:Uncharacterized protein n=1 Tax=Shewanella schlegeliana TaxID=190308 RepID=A0ABS1T1H8_9GAMM|nr:hypothetical protein [Shewanella schlegeliana]MBL4914656.1 hypothetical protein [Shewanella schlegeliana]MCL1110012.1 hypothetical protein [Shewanella schlegeliana]GIU25229.1 hypothetical protein TUM4433_09750 [Shewanella schlegeliana]